MHSTPEHIRNIADRKGLALVAAALSITVLRAGVRHRSKDNEERFTREPVQDLAGRWFRKHRNPIYYVGIK